MAEPRRIGLGYAAVALASILWAVGGTFARTLMDRGASPVELTEARAWIALVGVGAIVWARRSSSRAAEGGFGRGRLLFWLVVGFGLSIATANVTYYLSIQRLPVAVAIVVQYTAPGLVVLWNAMAGRQPPSRRVVAALLLAFAGVVLLAEVHKVLGAGETSINLAGFGFALASAVAFCAYILFGERVGQRIGPERAVFFGFLVASVFWVLVQMLRGRPGTLLDPSFIPGMLFLGIATTIAPFLLFLWGLGIVSASPAGIISTLEPVTGAIIAYLFLGQALGASQLAGAALVVVGIAVVQTDRPATKEVLAERAVLE